MTPREFWSTVLPSILRGGGWVALFCFTLLAIGGALFLLSIHPGVAWMVFIPGGALVAYVLLDSYDGS